ncbi:MAG: SDR family NAD(P)-dependent oxidoreductase [Euryarchaeota archaeon]|nr:SDR family NAD(P)-dependent oxidoreductase [Euryarchaeota archaeon]
MTPDRERLHDSLDGHVALVTGANRGLGRQIAHDLAALGATVYSGVRDPEGSDVPDGVTPLPLDVTDDAQAGAAAKRIEEDHGRLDILVNNAGIVDGWRHDILSVPVDLLDRVMATNFRGAVMVTRATLPLLLKTDAPRVVDMSSGMGQLEEMNGHAPAYRFSKVALNGLTRYLHGEYNEKGLIANSVCPGWVKTDMGGKNATRPVEKGAETPVWLSRFKAGATSGRFWRDKEPIPW